MITDLLSGFAAEDLQCRPAIFYDNAMGCGTKFHAISPWHAVSLKMVGSGLRGWSV
ncbi:hypothetical protein K2C03_004140 [Vibrio vulnificus]|nr:hypothetical protein [Vibrio vulnificus]